MLIRFGLVLMLAICFSAERESSAAEVQVHAAASLTNALKVIGAMYEKQMGNKVVFNFAASNVLARQIEEGAPGDLIFSADEEKMDQLEKKGLIRKDTRISLLSNSLVIVVSKYSYLKINNPEDLVSIKGNIVIADPRAVPAGIYAKQYLTKIGLWDRIVDRIIPADNVRAALAILESRNADAAIVYKTDAAISKKVVIAFEVSPESGPKIQYPLAILTEAENFESAKGFYDFLLGLESISVFRKHGFLILQ